jgi:hypothetical protein
MWITELRLEYGLFIMLEIRSHAGFRIWKGADCMYNFSGICKMANRFVKGGIRRTDAFRQAWRAAKQGLIEKVAGVTYEGRQSLLRFLDSLQKDRIRVSLFRDKANPFDVNAVAVLADVLGQGSYRVGYLPRNSAEVVANLMDQGVQFVSWLQGIIGGYDGLSYGMRIRIQV